MVAIISDTKPKLFIMKRIISIIIFSFLVCSQLNAQYARWNFKKADTRPGQEYQNITFDGAWCWFSDPRAVHLDGITYVSYVNSFGNIEITAYNNQTGEMQSKVLHAALNIDDHANPSLLILPDKRLVVFYTKHSKCCGGELPFEMFYRISQNPKSIASWSDEMITGQNTEGPMMYCYSNPAMLSTENNKLYLFWRGGNFRPNYSVSTDMGKSWSAAQTLIDHKEGEGNVRPYVKVSNNGKNRIHIAFTDGHPRDEAQNSIYYMQYRNDHLYKADGELISTLNETPVAPRHCHVVYDGRESGHKAWIWDVAEDPEGNPVLVYAVFPTDSTHLYYYSRWTGKAWLTHELVNSGSWFPETPKGGTEKEPNYSGGIVLDHEDPSTVYLSRQINGVFEIEKWTTKNNGKSWTVYPITRNSKHDNIRPFAVRHATDDNKLQVLWMNNKHYVHFTDYHTSIHGNIPLQLLSADLNKETILEAMHRVADWQLANPRNHREFDWHYGAFYSGLMALYETTKENRYLDEMRSLADYHDWKPINDIFHADRLTIGQMLIDVATHTEDDTRLEWLKWALDIHTATIYKAPNLHWETNPYKHLWWTWCDALFMAPPTFAKMSTLTGDQRYLDFANKYWWYSSDFLYDTEDHLYYRDERYLEKRSENGTKIFWSRGNGWVIGGLVHMLENMPDDYPDRDKYITQFREMAEKLAALQGEDGLWGVSLLDRKGFPIGESSGSAFFCYGIAWGINQGLLDESTYRPVAEKAWKALTKNVQTSGLLGYVQQVGHEPRDIKADDWEVYGAGAYLLAGSEMLKLID